MKVLESLKIPAMETNRNSVENSKNSKGPNMPKSKFTLILSIAAAGAIGYMALGMLFGEEVTSTPEGISQDFSVHIQRMSLRARVVDKNTGRSVFWFNADNGPSPRSVEHLPNGDVRVIFPGKK